MNLTIISFLLVAFICGVIVDFFLYGETQSEYSIPFAFASIMCTLTALILYFGNMRGIL